MDAAPGDVGVVPIDRGARIAVAALVDGRPSDVRVHAAADVGADPRLAGAPLAGTRIVWQDAKHAAPPLLDAGVRIDRVRDVRLVHRILVEARGLPREERWSRSLRSDAEGLFSLAPEAEPLEALAEQLRLQEAAISGDAGLTMLAGAESMGGLLAVELGREGLPFDRARHDALLEAALGERGSSGGRPRGMEALAAEVRAALGEPTLNPDSPHEVLRALRRAGVDVASTSRWELREHDHAAIEPLIAYKRMARLHTANGWSWAQRWARVDDRGRCRMAIEYVPGGVVTGRWATEGSGAMQIARQIRGAVAAEPGMRLVVADAAQLEPRALAALARDEALAEAGRGADLYQALVDRGVVDTRQHAKIGMLGALYGGTTGEAAPVLPRLTRAYPRAMAAVEAAARAGERRERVRTWLGRASPEPPRWRDDERGGRQARAWGRFTRNFVVQGTAAEWALAWMAGVRRAIREVEGAALVCFLHDEVIVQVPEAHAEEVARGVREAAALAGRTLFGGFPIEFPVQAAIVGDWGQAKDA